MSYIWESYSSTNRYFVGKQISPYAEIFTETNSDNRVNPLLRFSDIFSDIYYIAQEGMSREAVENVLFHYLASLDMIKGIDKKQININYLDEEIRSGYFGQDICTQWNELSKKDKKIILHILSDKYARDTIDNDFFLAVQKLFAKVSIIYEKNTEIYYVYLASPKTKYNDILINITHALFWDIQCKLQIIWGKHYGIIGTEETMIISDMIII